MRSRTPYPCKGKSETAFKINMSSVPGRRSAVLPKSGSPSLTRNMGRLS
jgi:hypothetical protein